MNLLKLILLSSLLCFVACGERVSTTIVKTDLDQTLNALMDEAINGSFNQIPGISMSIIAPDLDINWSGTRGYDSTKKDTVLTIDQPFRIASVTKTFVAAAILRLHEMEKLSVDDPIAKYISTEHIELLSKNNYEPSKITIQHCLNHTSGIFDYAMGQGSPYTEIAKKNINKRWTRTEQLEGAMEWGEKLWEPGKRYRYSDSGYVLLGEIIENFYMGDLAFGLRTLLKFEELGLDVTWLETLEPATANVPSVVHRYLRHQDFTDADASVDLYGGGGLVSTSPELAKFIHAIFSHQLFDQKATLYLMLTKPIYEDSYDTTLDKRFKDYRSGLWEIPIYGVHAYMHSGLWGSHMIHIPAYNASVSFNFTKARNDRLMKKVILVLKNLGS